MARSQRIAARILLNCDRYCSGAITHDRWHAEQHRLWTLAMHARCVRAVTRLVDPLQRGLHPIA